MSHPLRTILERFGLVRSEGQRVERYREADRLAREGKEAAEAARRQRLSIEVRSYRQGGGHE